MDRFESYKGDFARDGYVIARKFLSQQELAELEQNLSRYIHQIVPGLPPTDAFYEIKGSSETLKQMQYMQNNDDFFAELLHRNTYLELAEALLGMPAVPQGVEYFNKPAGVGRQTPPHQDGYYFTLVPSEALTLWFALDEVSEENGCVRYVPGSHKKGIRAHNLSNVLGFSQGIADWSPRDQACEVRGLAHPGDLLAHHCNTIHRADANLSQRSRRAVAIVYYAAHAVPDPEAKARYLESSKKQRITLQAG
jgi:ectoine hydroxylase-related dioxygenase (phytanoyl-CoA dioxygenase family)